MKKVIIFFAIVNILAISSTLVDVFIGYSCDELIWIRMVHDVKQSLFGVSIVYAYYVIYIR